MPSNSAAWITSSNGTPLEVSAATYPIPEPDELIIRTTAVAINPVDWKMQDLGLFIPRYPTIFGCDLAGTVEEVGSSVSRFKKGDRVISNAVCLVKGKEYAAFQSYAKTPANVTCRLPDNISDEQGCVLPLAINTAALGLFAEEGLQLPMPSLKVQEIDKAVFIYGGSTSVGSTAIQLAKAAGVYVVTTASKHNFDHCRSLGANCVIDYNDVDWIDSAAESLRGKDVFGAYDSVSHGNTTESCAKLLSKINSKSRVMSTNPAPEGVDSTVVFGANMFLDEKLAQAVWADFLEPALEQACFDPQPRAQVVGNGLEKVQEGMNMQKKGVSARKLVVKLG